MKHASTEQLSSWIEQLVAGDKQCFQQLISHIDERLLKLKRINHRRIEAEKKQKINYETDEFMQDLSAKLLTRCKSLLDNLLPVPPTERVTFFFGCTARMMRDLLIEEHRKQERRPRFIQPAGASQAGGEHESSDFFASVPGKEPNFTEQIARQIDFHEFVNGLPDKLKAVTDGYCYHGLTQAEVGEALGIATVTVRNRLTKVKVLAVDRYGKLPFE